MKTHPLDVSSLVFGLVFLGLVAGWSLYEYDVVTESDLVWYLPLVLIGAGVIGIGLSATRGRRARTRAGHAAPTVAEPPAGDDTERIPDEPTHTQELNDD